MSQPKSNILELSVSQISQTLKRLVEDNFSYVRIRGEVSGYRGPHSSGHAYFSLKDEKARIDAVVWRGVFGKLRFKPEEGMEVIATGKLSTFPGSSRYQIIIEQLEPAGVGALMALLEARKKKLAAEGLFDADRKQALPYLPKVIGVITSPTGAVIRDIMHRINDRFPCHVVIWPVRVQGDACAAEVSNAIDGFNKLHIDASQNIANMPKPDLLIVARGGGSLEDLWGFNEEIVARAVAASDIPLISAIGHETDTTLIDFVSDKRAPTPTAAAEMAVPVKTDLVFTLDDQGLRLKHSLNRYIQHKSQILLATQRGLPKLNDLLMQPRQKLDHAILRLQGALKTGTAQKRNQFERLAGRLSSTSLLQNTRNLAQNIGQLALRLNQAANTMFERKNVQLINIGKLLNSYSYKGVLSRGFALVLGANGKSLKSVKQAKPGTALDIHLADGQFGAVVAGANAKLDKPPKKPKKAAKSKIKPDNGQGNLFE
ncbi:MAG: exodeoxyribonuclease VII large subunit [Rhizobiales bacterium]|nr:exodeoxyribonuclease VII large subunit [Hyphomicrobiales bacterium]NRB14400.1 exodeoxyribonuclease VII large subunit [Hyphomicrobiales bacterium]